MSPLPSYAANDLFATDFRPHLDLPGFFPGAGGFFHGHADSTPRFLFFGTDFGPLTYQRSLPSTGGEPESVVTLRQLRSIVGQAGIRLDECLLTNAVLCVRRGESATDDFPIWSQHKDYVLACAAWHREYLAANKPVGVVLMGLPHLSHFGKLLFRELASHWHGLKTIKSVYGKGKEALVLPEGLHVLLMPHPSFWHAYPAAQRGQVIKHLSAWGSTRAAAP